GAGTRGRGGGLRRTARADAVPLDLLAAERVVDAVALQAAGLVVDEPVHRRTVERHLGLAIGTGEHAEHPAGHGAGRLALDRERLPELQACTRALDHAPGFLAG